MEPAKPGEYDELGAPGDDPIVADGSHWTLRDENNDLVARGGVHVIDDTPEAYLLWNGKSKILLYRVLKELMPITLERYGHVIARVTDETADFARVMGFQGEAPLMEWK